MDNLPGWVIPAVIAALLLLLLLIVLGAVIGGRKRRENQERDRRRAAELREKAEHEHLGAQERELQARESSLEADRAKLEAEGEQKLAQEQERDARQAREGVDDRLREADELDPDSSRSRGTATGTSAGGTSSEHRGHRADSSEQDDDGSGARERLDAYTPGERRHEDGRLDAYSRDDAAAETDGRTQTDGHRDQGGTGDGAHRA